TLAASTIADRTAAARQIVDELRHQYVLTFESSGNPGWHPLVIHARGKDLTVRARTGYMAGQSRPHSASARPQDSLATAAAFYHRRIETCFVISLSPFRLPCWRLADRRRARPRSSCAP